MSESMQCQKCGSVQSMAETCAVCGLSRSSFVPATLLGSTVGEDEMWAILAYGKIMDAGAFADGCIEAVADRIGMNMQKTRDFMEQNGWLLVRIQTTHKIVAVLQTQNAKVLPNTPSSATAEQNA